MFLKMTILGLCAGLMLSLTGSARAQAAGKTGEDKLARGMSATSVDFSKVLGIGSPSVASLGARIDSARQSADPIGLASASVELAALEKASGKTADIKADDLAKEAAGLAERRLNAGEIKTVAALLKDNAAAKNLTAAGERATKLEEQAKKDKEAGAKTKGIMGVLHVDNRTFEWVFVYVDDRLVGTIEPYGDGFWYVGQGPYETTFLSARTASGGVFSTRAVANPVSDFTWTLVP